MYQIDLSEGTEETPQPQSVSTADRSHLFKAARTKRNYKQNLEVEAKKLLVKKLKVDIAAQEKYTETLESQNRANQTVEKTQAMLK